MASGVIDILDHKKRSCPNGLEDDSELQIERLRIFCEGVAQSALEGTSRFLSSNQFPAFRYLVKRFLADGSPQSPKEDVT